jgi:CheY-like chemotaxis protein
MNMIAQESPPLDYDFLGTMTARKQGVIVIVTDDFPTIERLAPVFEFLDLRMEVVSANSDLMHVLQEQRPMAVICDMESDEQDGFHTMKIVAGYRRDLPLLLLTGGDPVLMGAADAVQELWGLTAVSNTSEFAMAGQLVAFLFTAGRHAGCMRLVPI